MCISPCKSPIELNWLSNTTVESHPPTHSLYERTVIQVRQRVISLPSSPCNTLLGGGWRMSNLKWTTNNVIVSSQRNQQVAFEVAVEGWLSVFRIFQEVNIAKLLPLDIFICSEFILYPWILLCHNHSDASLTFYSPVVQWMQKKFLSNVGHVIMELGLNCATNWRIFCIGGWFRILGHQSNSSSITASIMGLKHGMWDYWNPHKGTWSTNGYPLRPRGMIEIPFFRVI